MSRPACSSPGPRGHTSGPSRREGKPRDPQACPRWGADQANTEGWDRAATSSLRPRGEWKASWRRWPPGWAAATVIKKGSCQGLLTPVSAHTDCSFLRQTPWQCHIHLPTTCPGLPRNSQPSVSPKARDAQFPGLGPKLHTSPSTKSASVSICSISLLRSD